MVTEKLLVCSEYVELWTMIASKTPQRKITEYLLKCLVKRPAGFLHTFLEILKRINDHVMAEAVTRKAAGEGDESVPLWNNLK